jgi:tetrahydromethanopterin S-methyltransferase subunit F
MSLLVTSFARTPAEARLLLRASQSIEDRPQKRRRRPWRLEIGIYCVRQVLANPGLAIGVVVASVLVYLLLMAELVLKIGGGL